MISDVKDNGIYTDKIYNFNLIEPTGYMINIIQTNMPYQNVAKYRIEYIELHIGDEQRIPLDFNGDILSFT